MALKHTRSSEDSSLSLGWIWTLSRSSVVSFFWAYCRQQPLFPPWGLDSIRVVNSPWAPGIFSFQKLFPFSFFLFLLSRLPFHVPFQLHCWSFWPQICQGFLFLIRSFQLSPGLGSSWCWQILACSLWGWLTKPSQMLRCRYFATASV